MRSSEMSITNLMSQDRTLNNGSLPVEFESLNQKLRFIMGIPHVLKRQILLTRVVQGVWKEFCHFKHV